MIIKALTDEQIKSKAPSIFANVPHERLSDKYVMVQMGKIITDLRTLGWYPYDVSQARVIKANNINTQAHMIKFRQEKDLDIMNVGEEIFELLSVNGHNGRIPLAFYSGVFKVACENGLIVMQQDMGHFKVKHIGFTFAEMEELIINHVKKMKDVAANINEFKKITLDAYRKAVLATMIHQELKVKQPIPNLLTIRRAEDNKDDLWTTFNVIQENVIKGGVYYNSGPKNRRVKSRPIKNIQRDVSSNLVMWGVLNQFYSKII